ESVTVQFDLRHLLTKDEYAALRSEADIHTAFMKTVGPMLLERLVAFQGDAPLTFTAGETKGEILDHLRFMFSFRAKWVADLEEVPGFRMEIQRPFTRGDSYFEQEKGRLDFTFAPSSYFLVRERDEPPEAVRSRPMPELTEVEKGRLCRIAGRMEPTR